jgi:hypothetical protein
MRASFLLRIVILVFAFTVSCTDHVIVPEPERFFSEQVVSGLVSPFATGKGENGNLWITEVGTGNNDGKISVITPDNVVHEAIVGFTSAISEEDGLPDGLTHISYKDGMLYFVMGRGGIFYQVDMSDFTPGDAPIQASTLTGQNIGEWVLNYDFTVDTEMTHLFDFTWGPNGDIFFTDAAANAIIKRKSNGDLSVLTQFGQVANPLAPLGPPMVDFVPTGIVYDGTSLLVSSLTGFPFNNGKATIQKINPIDGSFSEYKGNFTALTDLVLTPANKPLALHFANFVLPGFQPNTGQILSEDGNVLLDGIMMPTDIERTGERTYYMTSMEAGAVYKVTY